MAASGLEALIMLLTVLGARKPLPPGGPPVGPGPGDSPGGWANPPVQAYRSMESMTGGERFGFPRERGTMARNPWEMKPTSGYTAEVVPGIQEFIRMLMNAAGGRQN